MENLWKLIKAAAETELHDLSTAAEKEWGELKDELESLRKDLAGENYQPQEYPKMVEGKIVHNATEEAALTGKPAPIVEPEGE